MSWLRRNGLNIFGALAIAYMLIPIVVIAVFSFNDPPGKFNFTWSGFTLDYLQIESVDPNLIGYSFERSDLYPDVLRTLKELRSRHYRIAIAGNTSRISPLASVSGTPLQSSQTSPGSGVGIVHCDCGGPPSFHA